MRKTFHDRRPQRPKPKVWPKDGAREVTVRNDDVETALKIFKRKVKKSNILFDIKKKEFFETRRETRRASKLQAIRRVKKVRMKERELEERMKFRYR
jgi:ribosomal protein S21|tara:strand:+ start:3223 stop:3513 length:291 start_codon:yes stop_codon:yes gene_type:complete